MREVDEIVAYADPIFRVLTQRDPIYKSGNRGIISTFGTRLFVFDKEIPHIEKFSHATDWGGPDDLPRTTITITIVGPQVAIEFIKEDVPQYPR